MEKLDKVGWVFISITIGLVTLLFYLVGSLIDHNYDIKMCDNEAKERLKGFDYRYIKCFANDDYNTINFGKDITCDCFVTKKGGFVMAPDKKEYPSLNIELEGYFTIE